MGLATIHTHSHKLQTKLYKISKFRVKRPMVSKIYPFENVKIYKEMYGHSDAVRAPLSVRMALHFFVDFDVFKLLDLVQN